MLVTALLLVSLGLALFRYAWWYALPPHTIALGYAGLFLSAAIALFGGGCGVPGAAILATAFAAIAAFADAVLSGHIRPASPFMLAASWACLLPYYDTTVCSVAFSAPAVVVVIGLLAATHVSDTYGDTATVLLLPFLREVWRRRRRRP